MLIWLRLWGFKIGGCADGDGEGNGDSCFANVPMLGCSDVGILLGAVPRWQANTLQVPGVYDE